ncbi:MAG: arylsulfatase [Planctomycetota bacterium]|jgi:arylsulfatase
MTSTAPNKIRILLATGLLVALSVIFAGCSNSEVEASANLARLRIEPLEVSLAKDHQPQNQIALHRRLKVRKNSGWNIQSSTVPTYLTESDGKPDKMSLNFLGVEQLKITIPGPFDPSLFDLVRLEVTTPYRRRLEVDFFNGERLVRVYATAQSHFGPSVLEFEVPAEVRKWKKINSILVQSKGEPQRVRIHAISLIKSPFSATMPSVEDGPRHIFSGGESRLGYALLENRDLNSTFEPSAGAQLRFSYAMPNKAIANQENVSIVLQLTGQNEHSERHQFDFKEEINPMDWRTVRMPLYKFGEGRISATWEIYGQGDLACAISEVGLIHKEAQEPQRVLLITSDTHRADHLGASGLGTNVMTPVLDALAERGILFEDCFSSTNTTNPSHVALMTGTTPRDTGVVFNNSVLGVNAPTLAESFRQAGFATYSSVSIKHLSPDSSGLGQGFDRAAFPTLSRSREAAGTIDKVLTWIKEADEKNLSAFIWVHLFDAHTPYETEDEYTEMYYLCPSDAFDENMDFPGLVPEPVAEKLYPGLQDINFPRAQYKAEISYLDEKLRRLFEEPAVHNAIIGFTADHGESLGAHDVYFSHDTLYPDSIHIPLILAFPDGPVGERSTMPVEQIDLGRTLLDLAGLSGIEFPGSNLLALAELPKDEAPPRFTVAAHFHSAAVTVDGWHMILSLSKFSGDMTLADPEMHGIKLFHLDEDLHCENNLLESEFQRASEMRRELIDWLGRQRDLGWDNETIDDAQTIAELEALGYTAGRADEAKSKASIFNEACKCQWCARF